MGMEGGLGRVRYGSIVGLEIRVDKMVDSVMECDCEVGVE